MDPKVIKGPVIFERGHTVLKVITRRLEIYLDVACFVFLMQVLQSLNGTRVYVCNSCRNLTGPVSLLLNRSLTHPFGWREKEKKVTKIRKE